MTPVPAPPGPHGQHHWPASYPECGSHAQSPINIQTDSVTFDPELPAVQPRGYDHPGTKPLDLHNNGHTGKELRLQRRGSSSPDHMSQR